MQCVLCKPFQVLVGKNIRLYKMLLLARLICYLLQITLFFLGPIFFSEADFFFFFFSPYEVCYLVAEENLQLVSHSAC